MNVYDVVIVGYGVSGLCLGSILDKNIKTLIVEHGKNFNERDHNNPVDSLIGCGGAGLFSDGKFSFYPAGTAVWNLENTKLDKSYANMKEDLTPYLNLDNMHIPVSNDSNLKLYPSYYVTLQQRLDLIKKLVDKNASDVLYNHLIVNICKNSDGLYNVKIRNNVTDIIVLSKYIVFAGGRFNSMYFPEFAKKFRRIEYGARIVADSNNASIIQKGIVDPKYIFNSDEYQARTFCWCKNGEYVLTDNLQGAKTYSGRSDVKKTSITNFGLNIRVNDPDMQNLKNLFLIQPYDIIVNEITSEELLYKLKNVMGIKYGEYFHHAFLRLLSILPHLKNNIRIVGPTIEGVGYYPDIDTKTLKLVDENMFACGDVSGIFRGIIPGMISGYHVAHTLNDIFLNM